MEKRSQIVLITGCSSGIGRELCRELAARNHRVFASARRLESIEDLKGEKIDILPLDVCDADSIEKAVGSVIESAGHIDMLINNAGYGQFGPMAELPLDDLRRQFETNVIAPLALIQAVTPFMVRQGSGNIINVGSISGIAATPYSGSYCASKAAIHLLSDALRMELAPFGIRVIQVQPGGVRSKFSDNASIDLEKFAEEGSLYRHATEGLHARTKMSQDKATPVEDFVKGLVDAITRDKPPAVYRAAYGSTLLPTLKAILPTAMLDKILSKKFGLQKLGR